MLDSPWFYDFKRTLTSRSTLMLMALILALMTFAVLSFVVSNNQANGYVDPYYVLANTALDIVRVAWFVALMAILGAFGSFGNDKIKGVLDSILAQPVTRAGLVFSRYFSTLCALATAVTASVMIVDLLMGALAGSFFSPVFVGGVILAFIIEIASILAIMFISSYLVTSSSRLLAIGMGLFVLFDLFWGSMINTVTELLGANANSAIYIKVSIASYFINPTELAALVYIITRNWFELITPIVPSSYGVSIFSLVVSSTFWLMTPLIVLLMLAKRRDLN